MLKPLGLSCGAGDVHVPRNVHIRCLEDRYQALDPTWQ